MKHTKHNEFTNVASVPLWHAKFRIVCLLCNSSLDSKSCLRDDKTAAIVLVHWFYSYPMAHVSFHMCAHPRYRSGMRG